MSDTKQTAVQWIVRELNNRFIGEIPMHRWDDVRDACQKALAMEREQIMEAREDGINEGIHFECEEDYEMISNEKYYTDHYGNK